MESLMNEKIELIENESVKEMEIPTIIKKEIVNTKGLFVRVPQGYEIVAEGLDGKLRTKTAGLRFFYPWDKKYVFYVKDTPIDFKKEKYKSVEGFEISVDSAITYHIVDSQKFYVQKNGIKQLKLVIGEILKNYASSHKFEEVNVWTLDIDLQKIHDKIKNMSSEQIAVDNPELVAKLLTLYNEYGISVSRVIIQKAELSEDLKKSKEEDSLTEAKNNRMIATANAELMAAKIKADAEKTSGEADSSIIAQRIQYIQKQIEQSSPEQLKLIKAILLGGNANYTVIENGMSDPTYSKFAYLNDKLQVNYQSDITELDDSINDIQKIKTKEH